MNAENEGFHKELGVISESFFWGRAACLLAETSSEALRVDSANRAKGKIDNEALAYVSVWRSRVANGSASRRPSVAAKPRVPE